MLVKSVCIKCYAKQQTDKDLIWSEKHKFVVCPIPHIHKDFTLFSEIHSIDSIPSCCPYAAEHLILDQDNAG